MGTCPLMSWCKCGGGAVCLPCVVLVVLTVLLAALALGYWLGRKKKS